MNVGCSCDSTADETDASPALSVSLFELSVDARTSLVRIVIEMEAST